MDWWRYGCEQLAALARAHGIALALLPGEDRDDERLAAGLDVAGQPSSRRCWAISARAAPTTCGRCCGGWRAWPAVRSRWPSPAPLPRAGFYGCQRRVARGPDPVLPIDAARRRRGPDRRAVRSTRPPRPDAGADLRRQPQGAGVESLPGRASGEAGSAGDPDRHRLRRRRRCAVRRRRCAGPAGGHGHDAARRLGGQPARPGAGRSRHACRDARAGRPHPRRGDGLQGRVAAAPGDRVSRHGQYGRARPRRARRRQGAGAGEAAGDAAGRASPGAAAARLSEGGRPRRLCRRPGCAQQCPRHPR